jgi:adenylate cyclase
MNSEQLAHFIGHSSDLAALRQWARGIGRVYGAHFLEHSLAVDASYARSYAVLAQTHAAVFVNRVDGDFLDPAAVDLAHRYARKAVALDPNLPDAHAVLGFVLVWMRQHDASIAEFERAVLLNPNYMDWRFGWALVLAGNPQRAIGVLDAYMRLDPFHAPVASCFVGYAYFMLGDYSRALRVLQDFVFRVPQAAFGYSWLAAAHAQLGQLDEARAAVAQLLRLRPGSTIGVGRRITPFKHAKNERLYLDALRKAGLPE